MKDLDFLKTWKWAHRGLHDTVIPENSLAAFKAAIDHNYAFECDVQASLEGAPVVFHDATLNRMTGHDDAVYHVMLDDLQALALKNSRETIPSLHAVLRLTQGAVPILIEIKTDSPVISLTNAVIESLKTYEGAVAIQSFSPQVVRHLKKVAPHLIRGQISSDFKSVPTMNRFKRLYLRQMWFNVLAQPDFINYDLAALPTPHVMRFKKRQKPVLGYTARTKKAYEEALKWVDNAVFEHFLP